MVSGMEKTDARTLNSESKYELRKRVIRLKHKDITNKSIAEILEVSVSWVSRIWQKYQQHGPEAIRPNKHGRPSGTGRKMTSEQESEVQKLIIDKTPDQLKLAFALWTREAVRLLIKQKFNVEMPVRSVGNYLMRWGFTPQKPIKQAYEQKPEAVKQWLAKDYPAIADRAKDEKAEIYWGDETGIQNDAYDAKGYAPKGKTPVVRKHAKKFRVNMVSAITNQGKVRFMMYTDTMNCKLLIKFMQRLIKDAGRKVFLILDNLRVHHGKLVQKWLEENTEKIEVFYLPSYSPELNPDEYLNGDLKRKIRSGIPARKQEDIEKKTRSFMKTLQTRPKHVSRYFEHEKITYAA